MPFDPALSPVLKLDWAETHIENVKNALAAFRNSKPYRTFEEDDPNGRDKHLKAKLTEPVPRLIGLLAADAVHNARASLDHLTHLLAVQHRAASFKGVGFPSGDTPEKFHKAVKEMKGKLSDAALDALHATEAYPRGAAHLVWALHALDITDKHYKLAPLIAPSSGVAFVGPTIDLHRIKPGEVIFLTGPMRLKTGGEGSMEDGVVIATYPRDSKPNGEVKPTLDVSFRDVDGLKGKPIVKALQSMAQAAREIIASFESKFFP